MAVGLLDQLDDLAATSGSTFSVAVITTYTVNLRFFEQLVLPRLRRLGCAYVGVITDPESYASTLDDPIGQDRCGLDYVLGKTRSRHGIQHGKLIWLHGEYELVVVGSHNLTKSGFNDQLEFTITLDSRQAEHVEPISSAHAAVASLTSESRDVAAIFDMIPKPAVQGERSSIQFLWSGNGDLLTQLRGSVPGQVDEIRVVTPFLDASALQLMADSLGSSKLVLDIPEGGLDVPLTDLSGIEQELDVRKLQGSPRILHAKGYEFRLNQGDWVAIGSANCTNAGLVRGVSTGGNSEFLVVCPGVLPDLEVGAFEPVSDLEFPGSGRNSDEREGPRQSLHLEARYASGNLTLTWSPSLQGKARATVGEQEFSISGDEAQIPWDGQPPRVVEVSGTLEGQPVVGRSWVVVTSSIEFAAGRTRAARWLHIIESNQPNDLIVGTDQYFQDLVRLLDDPEAHARVYRSSRPTSEEADNALDSFLAYSPDSYDSEEIRKVAAGWLTGRFDWDPLIALRAIIAKLQSSAPLAGESDADEVASHERRRLAALRSTSRLVTRHLRYLGNPRLFWDQTALDDIRAVLAKSFEAVIAFARAQVLTVEDVEESFNSLLAVFNRSKNSVRLRDAFNSLDVSGPASCALAYLWPSAVDARTRTEAIALLSGLINADPAQQTVEWIGTESARIKLVFKAHTTPELEEAKRDTIQRLRIPGELTPMVAKYQQETWRALEDVIEHASQKGIRNESIKKEIREAAKRYQRTEVWKQAVRTVSQTNRMPHLIRTRTDRCAQCDHQLAAGLVEELSKGDPVTCPACRTILLFGYKHRYDQ